MQKENPKMPAFIEQSLKELRAAKKRSQALRAYHWKHYSELAYQRRQIEDRLLLSLNEGSKSGFVMKGWQRAVKYKYSLHPLSTLGSLTMPGGRFNLGEIDSQNFPMFSALYIASDKDTALQETLGQAASSISTLTPQEIALTSPQSQTIVSVSGEIERVFDLREPSSLSKFARQVKSFVLSTELSTLGQHQQTCHEVPTFFGISACVLCHVPLLPNPNDLEEPQSWERLRAIAQINIRRALFNKPEATQAVNQPISLSKEHEATIDAFVKAYEEWSRNK